MFGWSGILLASFIYLHILKLLLATWQFVIYGFCLQTQMTLLKSEMENMLSKSLPVSSRIYRNLCIDWKVSPELNCCVSFFWDCIVGRVGEVNIKHFIWVQVAMCLLKWLPGTRLPASHRPSVPVLPVNPPAAPYRISHVNGKNLHCFRASLLQS